MKILGLYISSYKRHINRLRELADTQYQSGIEAGIDHGVIASSVDVELAFKNGYNKGKADGIADAKKAFTQSISRHWDIKQKGEINNDVLRQDKRG